MTDLQDLILDKLVGTTIGVNLPDSPLTIAASLIEGKRPIKFGRWTNYSAMSEIARRLGWPVIVVHAVQGGVRAIREEEGRRRFAMTVFRLLPVGDTPPKLSKSRMASIAAHVSLRLHPWVCTEPACEWTTRIAPLADAPDDPALPVRRLRCATVVTMSQNSGYQRMSRSEPKWSRFERVCDHVLTAFHDKTRTTAGFALREAVKLVITERGITEAVALVADIARRCGLATEAV